MGKILCATRGGEASLHTEEAAIKQAAENGDDLVFFYVVDVEFMARARYTMRSDLVREELEEMAEFLMAIAVERAAKKHVHAEPMIRHGEFGEELIKAATELDATLVILGRPEEDDEARELAGQAEQWAAETGIPFAIRP